ncbi:MAG: hypothetical protein K2M75_00820 [Clostridia bacterium]|nr:hypothetical protein [Clostridia bacterium]
MKNKWIMQLFPNLFKKQEKEEPIKTADDFIAEYLQNKQSNGERFNAKDYFAQDALDGIAVDKLRDALKKTLGCEKVEPCANAICKDWNDALKCVSISLKIFDCLEDPVMVNLVVDGETNVVDWVDVWIGEVNEPDSTFNLDAYPENAVDSNFIYENASQKVMDFILTKMV